jgi:hypothetical protein
MTRTLTRLTLLALAFALATYVFGWWGVPAVAIAWGLASRGGSSAGIRAGVAAMLAWALLIVVPPLFGAPTFGFAGRLAAAMTAPVWALCLAELAFPFAAAWSAATVASAIAARAPERDPAPVSR